MNACPARGMVAQRALIRLADSVRFQSPRLAPLAALHPLRASIAALSCAAVYAATWVWHARHSSATRLQLRAARRRFRTLANRAQFKARSASTAIPAPGAPAQPFSADQAFGRMVSMTAHFDVYMRGPLDTNWRPSTLLIAASIMACGGHVGTSTTDAGSVGSSSSGSADTMSPNSAPGATFRPTCALFAPTLARANCSECASTPNCEQMKTEIENQCPVSFECFISSCDPPDFCTCLWGCLPLPEDDPCKVLWDKYMQCVSSACAGAC